MAIEFKKTPLVIAATITDLAAYDPKPGKEQGFNIVLNSPYGMLGGYHRGPDAQKLFIKLERLVQQGATFIQVSVMPSWSGQGSAGGFVNHKFEFEILDVIAADGLKSSAA